MLSDIVIGEELETPQVAKEIEVINPITEGGTWV